MSSAADQPLLDPSPVGFDDELLELRLRIDRARGASDPEEDPGMLQDLETAYEELRVADEEVRAQQDHIEGLLERQLFVRWQTERMMAALPVPALISDSTGTIRTVNAAAAGLLQMRVSRLLGKPVLSFIAPEDRPGVRVLLSQQTRDAQGFRRPVTIRRRNDEPVELDCSVSPLPGSAAELSWTLLPTSMSRRDSQRGSVSLPIALARLASLPLAITDRQELLRAAATVCQEALGPGSAVSISAGSPSEPQAVASDSQLAQTLDGAQITAGEGPCVDAFDTRSTVVALDIHRDLRWPRMRQAWPSELQAVVSAPLEIGEHLVGAVNVYSLVEVDDDLVEECELLAGTVAAVLHELSTKHELQLLAEDMRSALTSRATIDQAKGIVMAHRGVGPDEAFRHLAEISSRTHTKIRDVALDLVERASGSS